jgi:hypothetical protein
MAIVQKIKEVPSFKTTAFFNLIGCRIGFYFYSIKRAEGE